MLNFGVLPYFTPVTGRPSEEKRAALGKKGSAEENFKLSNLTRSCRLSPVTVKTNDVFFPVRSWHYSLLVRSRLRRADHLLDHAGHPHEELPLRPHRRDRDRRLQCFPLVYAIRSHLTHQRAYPRLIHLRDQRSHPQDLRRHPSGLRGKFVAVGDIWGDPAFARAPFPSLRDFRPAGLIRLSQLVF